MSEFNEVFKRKEMKYRLTAQQCDYLEHLFRQKMCPDEYGQSCVTSLYYDSPAFDLIERSLDKPRYKEKLRLRVYGEPAPDARAFVEIKKKYKGIVYKRRVPMSLAGAQAFLSGMPYETACRTFPLSDENAQRESLGKRSLQIAAEIEYLRERCRRECGAPLAPSMFIVCERTAYADPSGSGLRVTIDKNLRYAPVDDGGAFNRGTLAVPDDMFSIIDREESIMELKNQGPLPLWLMHALDAIGTYPQSFSKYGTAYLDMRPNKEVCCA